MRADPETPDIGKLTRLVARLRAPDGCPWDRQQTLRDLRAYLLEEAHEVAHAIDEGDWAQLRGELGDLLFQLVFATQLAEESAAFTMSQVIDEIENKMKRRHPHVFGNESQPDAEAVHRSWERRKLRHGDGRSSLLAGLAPTLPSLLACYRMTQKASGVGFDWSTPQEVMEKLEEELQELRQAMQPPESGSSDQAIREELGDVLFTVGNLARHLGVDPESALAAANRKYQNRFQWLEAALRDQGKDLLTVTIEEMDALWEEAKKALETRDP